MAYDWRECHLHARNLLGKAGYEQLLREINGEDEPDTPEEPPDDAIDRDLFGNPVEADLFGQPIAPNRSARRR